MQKKTVIVWFRQDLRLHDNPALIAASKTNFSILPLYILDDENSGDWKMGAASRWWLYKSLISLNTDLDGNLCIAQGDAMCILKSIISQQSVVSVYWNRCYEPWRIKRDIRIKEGLKELGITAKSFNGSFLFEPPTTLKDDGTPYKVFTPFFKKGCLVKSPEPPKPRAIPRSLDYAKYTCVNLDELKLIPNIPWYKSIEVEWQPGEKGALQRLGEFLSHGIKNYIDGRNHPAQKDVSRLSPHLHFGEISPFKVWHDAKDIMMENSCVDQVQHFLRELGWREFSNNLLYHFTELPKNNLQVKFDAFPWRDDEQDLKRWQKGLTGYPIVDAGMRELWQTGYMHNRVRMIVGSFLVKNLLLHWHHGQAWFWNTLVDADLANNSASWQWIAGCGADAAPYFRVFNPVTQGKKFDKDGFYVRQYVPELSLLPDKFVHTPWLAPEDVLDSAKIEIGRNYPAPIVELKASRERALTAFKLISGK